MSSIPFGYENGDKHIRITNRSIEERSDAIAVPMIYSDDSLFGTATGFMGADHFYISSIAVKDGGYITDMNQFFTTYRFEYVHEIPIGENKYTVVQIKLHKIKKPTRDTIGRPIHDEKKDLSISFENLDPNMVDEVLRYASDLSKNTGVTTGVDIRPSEDS